MSLDTDNLNHPYSPLPVSELGLYLLAGFGSLLSLSLFLSSVYRQISIWLTVGISLANAICLGGTVLFLGVLRNKLDLAELGFYPLRWKSRFAFWAVIIALIFIPVRAVAGVLAQTLIEGGFGSLEARADLFAAGGELSASNFFLTLLGVGILVPISEELYFRGLLHRWFQGRFSLIPRIILSSAIFGLSHFDSIGVLASSFILGIINALAIERTRTIWVPILIHGVTNSIAVCLLYFSLGLNNFLPA